MGDTQFMPSNVAAYGVDADKNGKLDLWDSEEDIFYSSAEVSINQKSRTFMSHW
jgi:membrane-bound lytic murein transglycosylase B